MKSCFINDTFALIRDCDTPLAKCKIAQYMQADKYAITTDGDKIIFTAPHKITSAQRGLRVIGMITACGECGRDPMLRELQIKQNTKAR